MAKKEERMEQNEGLEEFLERVKDSTKWCSYHGDRSCYEAYVQLKKNLTAAQKLVEIGAMRDSALQTMRGVLDELEKDESLSPEERKKKIHRLMAQDPVIFLNDHGPDHVAKVIERADDIVSHFTGELLSEFETFAVLCAIQIHDIGNIMGRKGHERKLHEIFEQNCVNIILDRPEMRIIENVAMVHGGRTEAGKDTISQLPPIEMLFNTKVRSRLLAAIVRLADELADDSTRAHRAALDLGIVGTNSEIYHQYSEVLHTVMIEDDPKNDGCMIQLVYELPEELVTKTFRVGGYEKYLLDEIYDRTRKMELERRYCMKFMQQYVNIGRISVTINIYRTGDPNPTPISYVMEDRGYPTELDYERITTMSGHAVPTGEEIHRQFITHKKVKMDAFGGLL